jgi:hypothetical protein
MQTRFPTVEVIVISTADGFVFVEVDGWGSVGFDWLEEDEDADYDEPDVERFVETVAFHVADNLWPDEAVDPWPMCPKHQNHPLQVGAHLGSASWVCLRDPRTAVRVGNLDSA